jgi:hypothetical protein
MKLVPKWLTGIFHKKQKHAIPSSFNFKEKDGKFEAMAQFQNEDFQYFTGMLVQTFQDCGAVNYLDIYVTDSHNFERYKITIKKDSRLNRNDVNKILRNALEKIIQMNYIYSEEYLVSENALRKCGYLSEDETLANLS